VLTINFSAALWRQLPHAHAGVPVNRFGALQFEGGILIARLFKACWNYFNGHERILITIAAKLRQQANRVLKALINSRVLLAIIFVLLPARQRIAIDCADDIADRNARNFGG
jgi:hypothetical protein